MFGSYVFCCGIIVLIVLIISVRVVRIIVFALPLLGREAPSPRFPEGERAQIITNEAFKKCSFMDDILWFMTLESNHSISSSLDVLF